MNQKMMEYVIINKDFIQKRLEELDTLIKENNKGSMQNSFNQNRYRGIKKELKSLLDNSTSLITEVEKAFNAGRTVKNYKAEWMETYSDMMTSPKFEEFKDYIAYLKNR